MIKRILILCNHSSGLYQFRKELLESLLLENYEVYATIPDMEYIGELKELGITIIMDKFLNRRGTNPLSDLKLIFFYKKIVTELKPSVVLTYTIKPNIYGGFISKRFNVPYIVNVTGLGSAVTDKGFLRIVLLGMYRASLRNAYNVYFQNSSDKDLMLASEKMKDTGYELIPGSGVNIRNFSYQDYPESDKIKFLYVSRLMREKGIDQYLEASNIIKNRYSNVEFHVCGECEEGEYTDIIEEYEKGGVVVYHGEIKNIKEMYGMAHCIIHPTYYAEGMSNVLLEAASTGRPLIATDRPGCREIVEDGKNGFIISEKNTKSLVCAIERFIELSYEEKKGMGIYSRNKVKDQFDRGIVVNSYLRSIESATS